MPLERSDIPHYYLTRRERQVFALLLRDVSTKEIAHQLQVQVGTVWNCITNIFDKTGVTSRVGLLSWAMQNQRDAERGVVCRIGLHKPTCTCPDFCDRIRSISEWTA